MDIFERGDGHDDRGSRDGSLRGARRQVAVASGEAGRCEAQVELTVTSGEVPHARGEKTARREVVGGQHNPTAGVGRVGDQPAIELVERIGKSGEVTRLGVRGQVDVLGVVAAAVRLDRRATDQHEPHTMARKHAEQRLPTRFYATGICRLSHAWIFSSSLRSSATRASCFADWTSSTALQANAWRRASGYGEASAIRKRSRKPAIRTAPPSIST